MSIRTREGTGAAFPRDGGDAEAAGLPCDTTTQTFPLASEGSRTRKHATAAHPSESANPVGVGDGTAVFPTLRPPSGKEISAADEKRSAVIKMYETILSLIESEYLEPGKRSTSANVAYDTFSLLVEKLERGEALNEEWQEMLKKLYDLSTQHEGRVLLEAHMQAVSANTNGRLGYTIEEMLFHAFSPFKAISFRIPGHRCEADQVPNTKSDFNTYSNGMLIPARNVNNGAADYLYITDEVIIQKIRGAIVREEEQEEGVLDDEGQPLEKAAAVSFLIPMKGDLAHMSVEGVEIQIWCHDECLTSGTKQKKKNASTDLSNVLLFSPDTMLLLNSKSGSQPPASRDREEMELLVNNVYDIYTNDACCQCLDGLEVQLHDRTSSKVYGWTDDLSSIPPFSDVIRNGDRTLVLLMQLRRMCQDVEPKLPSDEVDAIRVGNDWCPVIRHGFQYVDGNGLYKKRRSSNGLDQGTPSRIVRVQVSDLHAVGTAYFTARRVFPLASLDMPKKETAAERDKRYLVDSQSTEDQVHAVYVQSGGWCPLICNGLKYISSSGTEHCFHCDRAVVMKRISDLCPAGAEYIRRLSESKFTALRASDRKALSDLVEAVQISNEWCAMMEGVQQYINRDGKPQRWDGHRVENKKVSELCEGSRAYLAPSPGKECPAADSDASVQEGIESPSLCDVLEAIKIKGCGWCPLMEGRCSYISSEGKKEPLTRKITTAKLVQDLCGAGREYYGEAQVLEL